MPEAPAGVPDSFQEHMRLMFDLQVLALQTDLTRVITFKTGFDQSNRTFPESGSGKSIHGASHHGNVPADIMDFHKINTYRLGQVAYLLEKLLAADEGGTSLLDKTAVVWGSPMADPNLHNHRRCPLLIMGRANGALGGRYSSERVRRHTDGERVPWASCRSSGTRTWRPSATATGCSRSDIPRVGRRPGWATRMMVGFFPGSR